MVFVFNIGNLSCPKSCFKPLGVQQFGCICIFLYLYTFCNVKKMIIVTVVTSRQLIYKLRKKTEEITGFFCGSEKNFMFNVLMYFCKFRNESIISRRKWGRLKLNFKCIDIMIECILKHELTIIFDELFIKNLVGLQRKI